jgi:urease accessory protein
MATTDFSVRSGQAPLRVGAVIGNTADSAWHDRLQQAHVDVLRLDQAAAQKSRLRAVTDRGDEVLIALDRATQLRDGDILRWNESGREALVARIEFQDVLIIDLSALQEELPELSMARCVEVGHALGNQHWPAVIKGTRIYVPLTLAKAVMTSVMNTHAFEGVSYTFAPGAEVIPYLAPHETRRLFGGTEGHHHAGPPGGAPR